MLLHRLFRSATSRPAVATRRRPATRLSVEALEDRAVPASLSVGDALIVEGDAGARYAQVNVTLDVPAQ